MIDTSVKNGPSWMDARIVAMIVAISRFLPPPVCDQKCLGWGGS